jgi:hypothetical protein
MSETLVQVKTALKYSSSEQTVEHLRLIVSRYEVAMESEFMRLSLSIAELQRA